MLLRASLCAALCCAALVLAGCGSKTEPAPKSEPPPAGLKQVTLHVKDMAERLDLA